MEIRKCFACGKTIKGKAFKVDCIDDQKGVEVGPDCYNNVMAQAKHARLMKMENPGYMPRSGGPSLIPAQAAK